MSYSHCLFVLFDTVYKVFLVVVVEVILPAELVQLAVTPLEV